MPDIPATHRYFPSVPLSELSDLYSKGNQRLDGNRAAIISYLPKTLRVGRELPFNNKYVLFIEGTSQVDRIEWSLDLFLNGERIANPGFVEVASSLDQTELTLWFQSDVIDVNGQPICDRIKITCEVENNGQEITLTAEHNLVAQLSATGLATADVTNRMTVPFSGEPVTTNYLLNHLKDYLQPGVMTWNNKVIDFGVPASDPLLKIVTAILYHNILNSQPDASALGLQEVAGVEMRSFFNDGEPYEGNFVNGICRIPLHILSDVLTAQLQVPDFTAIGAGNGNPVYNIIRDQGLFTYSNLEGDVLRTVPQKIQDSKQRLLNDPGRFLELYHLTLFPKSAIKLAALVVKYLHECSILNQCNECKGKNILWRFVTLEGLKDHPEFLKNILTHYFREPSNKIESFAREASRATSFVWSPAVHTVMNVAPRIVKAYFARKVVRHIDALVGGVSTPTKIFEFERIDGTATRVDGNGVPINPQPEYDSVLGKKVYLVVETLHCRTREVAVKVLTNNNFLTGNTDEALSLLSGRDDMSVDAGHFVDDMQKIVGNPHDLKNANDDEFNDAEREYLQIDHQDKAVVKVRIRPRNTNDFHGTPNSWATTLGRNTARIKIQTRLVDGTSALFGSDFSTARASGEFVSVNDPYVNETDPDRIAFRVVNRNLYEMYQDNEASSWNFLLDGVNRRRIGKISNAFVQAIADGSPDVDTRRACLFFYDELDNEHLFGDFALTRPNWIATANYLTSHYLDGRSTLLDANDFLPYSSGEVRISLLMNTVTRRHVDVGCFAALLSAMAAHNITRLGFNGFSNNLGQSIGGSVSHRNGLRGDLRYLRTAMDGAACLLSDPQFDEDLQTDFHNSLHNFGWARRENMLSERFNGGQLLPHTAHFHRISINGTFFDSQDVVPNQDHPQLVLEGPFAGTQQNNGAVIRHNNHLHIQGFDFGTLKDILQ